MPKAWDIQPSAPRGPQPKNTVPPQAAPVPRPTLAPTRPRLVDSLPKRAPVRPPVRCLPTAQTGPRVPLGRRRRMRRKQLFLLVLAVVFVVVVMVEALLWQPWLRVQNVVAEGINAQDIQVFVQHELSGTHFLVLPKNSIFFIPQKNLRARTLAAFPQVEAISIIPSGLTTLKIVTTGRASVLWWCGTAIDTQVHPCYQTDSGGMVFAQVPPEDAQASSSTLSLYAPLAQAIGASPVGNSVANPTHLAGMIQFVKAMRTLGADVVSVAIRGDEADVYTRAGTRITYVLGREQQAAGLATSAFPTLNLNDGSLLYVDLRFDSKVFFKKK